MASRSSSVKPLTMRRPPGAMAAISVAAARRSRRAGQVAEDDVGDGQGLGEHVADARLDRAGGELRSASTLPSAESSASRSSSMAIDRPRPELRRGDGQHARSGADVDDRSPGERRPLQRGEAQPRRFVVAGAEAHRRLDDDRSSAAAARVGLRVAGQRRARRPRSHGGVTTIRPTRIAVSDACDRSAQASSSTSIGGGGRAAPLRCGVERLRGDRARFVGGEEHAPGEARRRAAVELGDGGGRVVVEPGREQPGPIGPAGVTPRRRARRGCRAPASASPEDVLDALEERLVAGVALATAGPRSAAAAAAPPWPCAVPWRASSAPRRRPTRTGRRGRGPTTLGRPLCLIFSTVPLGGAVGHVQRVVAVERRHLHRAAERERGEGDAQLAVQIVVVALEERVVGDDHDDVEIARRAALGAVLAFARQAQALAGGDAGRDLHLQIALLGGPPVAAAGRARLGDDAAGAAAVAARLGDGEEALLVADLAGAAALRAGLRPRAARPSPSPCTSCRSPRAGCGSASRCPWPPPRRRSRGRSAGRRHGADRRAGRRRRSRRCRRGRRGCRRSRRRPTDRSPAARRPG